MKDYDTLHAWMLAAEAKFGSTLKGYMLTYASFSELAVAARDGRAPDVKEHVHEAWVTLTVRSRRIFKYAENDLDALVIDWSGTVEDWP